MAAFDLVRQATPGLTDWALSNALASYRLAGSDTAMIGGDLAYAYAHSGSLSDISFGVATGLLGSTGFGSTAQTFHLPPELVDNTPRLS